MTAGMGWAEKEEVRGRRREEAGRPDAARRGKREAAVAGEDRSVREGRDKGGEVEVVEEEEERRWKAASSERKAEREPEAEAEAEAGESISSTSMSSASMDGGGRGAGFEIWWWEMWELGGEAVPESVVWSRV